MGGLILDYPGHSVITRVLIEGRPRVRVKTADLMGERPPVRSRLLGKLEKAQATVPWSLPSECSPATHGDCLWTSDFRTVRWYMCAV